MKQPQIEFWQGISGMWYLRVRAANGLVVFDGGQGYSTKSNAKRAAKRAKEIVKDAVIADEVQG